jgi:hypothetical protein
MDESGQTQRRLHRIEGLLLVLAIIALVANFDRVEEKFGLLAAVASSAFIFGIWVVHYRRSP